MLPRVGNGRNSRHTASVVSWSSEFRFPCTLRRAGSAAGSLSISAITRPSKYVILLTR
jgi:hypothetical protein